MENVIINSKKKLPMGLMEKQELQRQETINKVLRAIADIKAEGGNVTIPALMEYTGLARSTFAKPNIRELLVGYGYASCDDKANTAKRKKAKLNKVIEEKDRQIEDLKIKNAELQRECELLRGQLFLIIQASRN